MTPQRQNRQPTSQGSGATKTVTIIDGKTGARQEVAIPVPGSGSAAGPADSAPRDQKFVEMTTHGAIPKIADDGVRPAEAFARPVKPLPGKPDAPRIALIVGGLGVSANVTSEAIAKLPGAVTLALMPYGTNVERLAAQAREAGHEILLQVPMEPFGYPDNDPGPQTLLTSLTPEQNLERLHWLMSRFQGYVGVADASGARFTASEQSFAPVLRETAKRGLIYVDDGSNPRSVAGRIAGANNLPFAKADSGSRFRSDAERNRPRARPPGNGRARARPCRRRVLGIAGFDRAHRQMGEGRGKPRLAAGSDHRRGVQSQTELRQNGEWRNGDVANRVAGKATTIGSFAARPFTQHVLRKSSLSPLRRPDGAQSRRARFHRPAHRWSRARR